MADSKKYDGSQWEHSLRKLGTATETIQSGDTIYANGQPISTYSIKGNTVQNGTPTPSNPVDVNGVGERTANLFDINGETDVKSASVTIINNGIKFENVPSGNTARIIYSAQYAAGTYHISCVASGSNDTVRLFSDSSFAGATYNSFYGGYYRDFTMSGFSTSLTFETDFKIGFIANAAGGATFTISNIMLSTTEADFEPYGYKIPISSANTTTPVYLGEVQSTRKIEKIKLDELTWTYISTTSYSGFYIYGYTTDLIEAVGGYCNKLDVYTGTFTTAPNNSITIFEVSGNQRLFVRYDDAQGDTTALMTTLNGAVFYAVKATPTTGTVNEPLMKIGDYADSISDATAIPTTDGANTITVDTTVQPSEFTATWTGWHDASVKEWDGSQWNE